jgi:hypothetical protein
MTPKEKAEELYYRFTVHAPLHTDNKQCALIAVDELINYSDEWDDSEYWKEVKQEIEKL